MYLGESRAGILGPEDIAWEILLEPAECHQAVVNDHLDIEEDWQELTQDSTTRV